MNFYVLEDIDLWSSNLHAIEIFSHTISHKSLVILAIIGAELAGGRFCPPPSRARNSEPHSRERVKLLIYFLGVSWFGFKFSKFFESWVDMNQISEIILSRELVWINSCKAIVSYELSRIKAFWDWIESNKKRVVPMSASGAGYKVEMGTKFRSLKSPEVFEVYQWEYSRSLRPHSW